MLVPETIILPLKAPTDLTSSPGAITSIQSSFELNSDIIPFESIAPTDITLPYAAGYNASEPVFPAAAITKILFFTASSIASFNTDELSSVPKLIFIIFTFLSIAQ